MRSKQIDLGRRDGSRNHRSCRQNDEARRRPREMPQCQRSPFLGFGVRRNARVWVGLKRGKRDYRLLAFGLCLKKFKIAAPCVGIAVRIGDDRDRPRDSSSQFVNYKRFCRNRRKARDRNNARPICSRKQFVDLGCEART
jgi:hypothetical protein